MNTLLHADDIHVSFKRKTRKACSAGERQQVLRGISLSLREGNAWASSVSPAAARARWGVCFPACSNRSGAQCASTGWICMPDAPPARLPPCTTAFPSSFRTIHLRPIPVSGWNISSGSPCGPWNAVRASVWTAAPGSVSCWSRWACRPRSSPAIRMN